MTHPFIRKDNPLAKELGLRTVEIDEGIYEKFEKIANDPRALCSVKVAINSALAAWLGMV